MPSAHKVRRTPIRRVVALGLVSLGVASCGGHGSGTTTAAKHTTPSATPAAGSPTVAAKIAFPTNVAFDSKGGIWVTSGSRGQVATDGIWYVPPGGKPRHVVGGLTGAVGLTWAGDRLYVAHQASAREGQVTAFSGFTGSKFTGRHTAVGAVPVGEHTMGSIVQGPDGRLYFKAPTVSDSSGPYGTVLSFKPGGHGTVVEAKGLNSGFGLAFQGKRLVLSDTGRDDLGPNRPPEELDAFDPAGSVPNFGYPGCYEQGGPKCKGTRAPLATFPAHATPSGVAVKGDVAYVAENGSGLEKNPTGSDVVRVDLRTGHHSVLWRSPVKHDPLGAAIGADGNLYVTLYVSGKVVRFDL